ncbi:hypothetical protein [Streptomyces sp. AC1-42T]|nr:hypothetical protein [Streptomyces sp. AC1-42T]
MLAISPGRTCANFARSHASFSAGSTPAMYCGRAASTWSRYSRVPLQ